MELKTHYDVVIIGAGAAGLMCALTAGERRRSVLLLDHAPQIGKKILISGGGRCNFTNRSVSAAHYLSNNPHFCKSALSRFTPDDFIAMVEKQDIAYHEKTLGQLFCNGSARDILNMLLRGCEAAGVQIRNTCTIKNIQHQGETTNRFILQSNLGEISSDTLVIATGGRSFPKIGASDFGYRVAQQFDLKLQPNRPGLVPLYLNAPEMKAIQGLSGISAEVIVKCRGKQFRDALLFTHKGLSGPAILQISNNWHPGDEISINLLPDINLVETIHNWQKNRAKTTLKNLLAMHLSKRLAQQWLEQTFKNKAVDQYSAKEVQAIAAHFHQWRLIPSGTAGYRVAEVTLGGVDTDMLSSKTFEVKTVPGLYFIGEVLDVTGWLGGYNFQWAWSSGYCAGELV
ncbi:MAG: NAD(P)/FAD-dependent oxidoreductase [Nitrospirae bacterium]|nr:NAD(P)/FAD-dependent oxidoreductase [Candidatus Manganitrophaceae bacterium]